VRVGSALQQVENVGVDGDPSGVERLLDGVGVLGLEQAAHRAQEVLVGVDGGRGARLAGHHDAVPQAHR